MSVSSRGAFRIHVVDGAGNGLQGVKVVIAYGLLESDGSEVRTYPESVGGLTYTDGWIGIRNLGRWESPRAEVFLNNKSYGFYWCENGAQITITM